jgi:hypothetical protein
MWIYDIYQIIQGELVEISSTYWRADKCVQYCGWHTACREQLGA